MPLSLEQRCVRQFPKTALSRGRHYFEKGKAGDPNWLGPECSLTVVGTGGSYDVRFDFSQVTTSSVLPMNCSCPAFAKGATCKHLWTAILQIEKKSTPGQIPESGPLRLIRERNGGNGNGNGNGHGNGNHRRGREPMQALAPEPVSNLGWRERLDLVQGTSSAVNTRSSRAFSAFFVISGNESAFSGRLVLDLWVSSRSFQGDMGPLRPSRVSSQGVSAYEHKDEVVLTTLLKTSTVLTITPPGRGQHNIFTRFVVDPTLEGYFLQLLAQSGRLLLSRNSTGAPDSGERPLRIDSEATWVLELKLVPHGPDHYRLDGALDRPGEHRSLNAPVAILREGFLVFDERIGRFVDPTHARWAHTLKSGGDFVILREDGEAFLSRVMTDKEAPKITWPGELGGWKSESLEPTPIGVFRPLNNDPTTGRMSLTVSFDYAGREIPLADTSESFVDAETKKLIKRNRTFEEQTLIKALQILRDPQGTGTVPSSDLHRAAQDLVAAGWLIYMEGKKLRIAQDFALNVSSGADWFDLRMDLDYGSATVSQEDLLAALDSKSGLVKLSDGTLGMVPQAWTDRFSTLGQFGEIGEDGNLRFDHSQALLLNSVIGDSDRVTVDEDFEGFREKVRKFQGVKTVKAPAGFLGDLRNYQKEGLTWLRFLEEFNAGGILADDMGLGKTIQILAFLLGRVKKKKKGEKRPCLVVTPKSLAFNWIDEAQKFAPTLKMVRYGGDNRAKQLAAFDEADVIVMTYGTLRSDIADLQKVDFDVAVIDEAQAIKNPKSQAAVACKEIRATLKIALTGTPIENSITDLLSILEFTNPGLLADGRVKNDQAALAKLLKPFMLRRTKEKVLTELPDKSEQVLYCEMSDEERVFYGAIRDRYRSSIAEKIEKGGLGKSKLHVLEALLRLRQAACHSGLIDPTRLGVPSGKLVQLLRHMQEVIQEGHKVLVFSQFTSLLSIVRTRLEEEKITYEYLDGSTEDRKTPVERFQTDPACPAFLISLKAGGTGLNLTAADYVFILDPWWNPAVEAQAIGRAHRMGQTNKVIAYRMIAKGTVEEKILELQKTKKDLAESIVSEDGDFMKKLTKADLEMLLE